MTIMMRFMGAPSWVPLVMSMFIYFFLTFLGSSMQGSETHKKRKGLEESSTCSKCGAKVHVDAKFCPKCGGKFEKKSKKEVCSECGIEVSPSDKFCPQCGEKFE
jgi:ribosomal protein L40E